MHRHLLVVLSGCIGALIASAPASGDRAPQAKQTQTHTPVIVEGKVLGAPPESRLEATQAIDAAVAAAVIGAISRQFGERKVEVKLDRMQTAPANLVDLHVSGAGRMRIGDDPDWLALRFDGMYDSAATSIAQPRIVIGDDGAFENIAPASGLWRELQANVAARLGREFSQQTVMLRLDRITRRAAGGRYARIDGTGAATFDRGSAPVSIDALYDLQTRSWLRISYELSDSAERAPTPAASTGQG